MIRRTLVFPSEHKQLDHVLEFIQQFAKEEQLGEELLDNLMLLGSEAATNAIEHGNQNDPSKQVILHLDRHQDRIELSVEDEGVGFSTTDAPDSTG